MDGNPGGHLVPGDGNLNLDQALHTLEAFDYKGYLGLEILDRRYVMNPEDAMRRALAWYSERIGLWTDDGRREKTAADKWLGDKCI